MREANRSARALDDMCSKRRVQRLLCGACVADKPRGWTAQNRCEEQGLASGRWKSSEACVHQSFQRLRNTDRLHRVDVRAQSLGELERVERVSAGGLVHTQQGRACERLSEAGL
jgi:hypothetical protein